MAERTPKPSMFSAGDTVATGMGEATVVKTRGQAWVKVSGIKRTWWSTSELAALNPEAAEKFNALKMEAQEAAEREAAEKRAQREAKAADREAKKAVASSKKSRKSKGEQVGEQVGEEAEETADQAQEEPVAV